MGSSVKSSHLTETQVIPHMKPNFDTLLTRGPPRLLRADGGNPSHVLGISLRLNMIRNTDCNKLTSLISNSAIMGWNNVTVVSQSP